MAGIFFRGTFSSYVIASCCLAICSGFIIFYGYCNAPALLKNPESSIQYPVGSQQLAVGSRQSAELSTLNPLKHRTPLPAGRQALTIEDFRSKILNVELTS